MDADELSQHLTALKSLLRLHSDGVCAGQDLLDALSATKAAVSRYEALLRDDEIGVALLGDEEVVGSEEEGEVEEVIPRSQEHLPLLDGEEVLRSEETILSPEQEAEEVLRSEETILLPPEQEEAEDMLPPLRLSRSSSTHSSWRSSTSTVSTTATTVSHEDKLCEEEEEEDAVDPTFDRLSTILLSLQQEAEAAVSSPVPTPEFTLRRRGRADSEPSTPCPRLELKPPQLVRTVTTPSIPSTPRRLSEPLPLSRTSTAAGMDLDKLLSDFLDEGILLRQHEGIFKFVWVYILAGAIVWAMVGMVLGWGCEQRCTVA